MLFTSGWMTTRSRVRIGAHCKNLIDIYENNGLHAVVTCVIDLENGFYGLLTKRKGGVYPCPIFCLGPFAENEITLLAGASWDMKKKRLKPLYADGIAKRI